ncbi:MAG: TlyA family RNA methyltransferase, partial [Hungatella sp.]
GREKVGKKGVVREKSTHLEVMEAVIAHASGIGFGILNLEFSPIKGPEGNIEYLLYLQNNPEQYPSAARAVNPEEIVEEAHKSL